MKRANKRTDRKKQTNINIKKDNEIEGYWFGTKRLHGSLLPVHFAHQLSLVGLDMLG